MTFIYAIILGILQGLTEFLPVSSSGHLILFESIFGISENNMFFNIVVHVATLVAVIIIFWKDVVNIIKHPFGKDMQFIVIATIPTIVIALITNHFIDDFTMKTFLGFGFLVSAVITGTTAILQKKKHYINSDLNYGKSFMIGVVQGLAVMPGISRSGSTICAGLLQGVGREKSASFSFLISIPVILGGMFFELVGGIKNGFGTVDFASCSLGFVFAFITALFTIKLMLKFVKKGNWIWFSIYLFALSVVVILNQFVFAWF